MRQALRETGVIEHGGKIVGVNLGYDFAAEHEWGFKWASRYLGRPIAPSTEQLGVAARSTTKVEPEFSIELVEHDGALWMRGQQDWRATYGALADDLQPKAGSHNMQALASSIKHRSMVAGWNTDDGFCVAATDEAGKAAIRLVHDALVHGRCFIIQSGGVFGAGGLKLIDADLVPPEIDQELMDGDRSRLKLDKAVAATGIRERLEAAGRRFYALSPKWEDEAKGAFIFWLNPTDQDRNNHGWFTVADLDAWIDGKGPIPKSRAA